MQEVKTPTKGGEVLDGSVAREVAPAEMVAGPKKEMMEERSAAYWTTIAPNVEDYSGSMAKVIAKGSGMVIKGILWCGDVTVDRLRWGDEFLKKRMGPNDKTSEISKDAMKRIKRYLLVLFLQLFILIRLFIYSLFILFLSYNISLFRRAAVMECFGKCLLTIGLCVSLIVRNIIVDDHVMSKYWNFSSFCCLFFC